MGIAPQEILNQSLIVGMGCGFEVIDLGVDVKTEKFIDAVKQHPEAFIGLSALLTTTMGAMEKTNRALKEAYPNSITFIGGDSVSDKFREQIGADYYSADPQGLVEILNKMVA